MSRIDLQLLSLDDISEFSIWHNGNAVGEINLRLIVDLRVDVDNLGIRYQGRNHDGLSSTKSQSWDSPPIDNAGELIFVMVEMVPSLEDKAVTKTKIIVNEGHFLFRKARFQLKIYIVIKIGIMGREWYTDRCGSEIGQSLDNFIPNHRACSMVDLRIGNMFANYTNIYWSQLSFTSLLIKCD